MPSSTSYCPRGDGTTITYEHDWRIPQIHRIHAQSDTEHHPTPPRPPHPPRRPAPLHRPHSGSTGATFGSNIAPPSTHRTVSAMCIHPRTHPDRPVRPCPVTSVVVGCDCILPDRQQCIRRDLAPPAAAAVPAVPPAAARVRCTSCRRPCAIPRTHP